jgi:hypothetical protein
VTGQVPVDDVGGVGVSVEVHDADVAVAVHVGHGGGRGPGDGVIPAEHDRHDAARGDRVLALLDVLVGHLGHPVRAEGVAEVHDLQPVEDLQAEVHVIGAGFVGRGADGARTEAGAGPVRGRDVERGADDRDVGSPRLELLHLGEERPMPERRQPGVRQVDLLGHSRRQLAVRFSGVSVSVPVVVVVPVPVTHALTVPPSASLRP